ncbi:hypothetical protein RHCRD62_60094 [Rhodococcus sp. RD6.2]|nr:hypothetical protein RHCRD62_60094 [Rhodococcus sp. RD6.2]
MRVGLSPFAPPVHLFESGDVCKRLTNAPNIDQEIGNVALIQKVLGTSRAQPKKYRPVAFYYFCCSRMDFITLSDLNAHVRSPKKYRPDGFSLGRSVRWPPCRGPGPDGARKHLRVLSALGAAGDSLAPTAWGGLIPTVMSAGAPMPAGDSLAAPSPDSASQSGDDVPDTWQGACGRKRRECTTRMTLARRHAT